MYPLPVVLVGCSERLLPHVRRELANAGIDIMTEFHSCEELLARRSDFRADPHLFIVHVETAAAVQDLQRLSGCFLGRPVLALLEQGKDPDALIATMRAGAAQVVPLPLAPSDFLAALHCIGLHFGHTTVPARLIAVSGVTGGCGATTLASNLAFELAHLHSQRTILAEMSLQMGMLDTYLDIKPEYTLYDLLAYEPQLDVQVVEKALAKCGDSLRVLAGPNRPITATPEACAKIPVVIEYLRYLAEMVVLDVPCTFDDGYFHLLASADQVILVGEQRIPAIRNVQLVLNELGGQGRPDRSQSLVLNRYDPNLAGFAQADLEKLLGLSRIFTLTNDPVRLTAALNQGRPLRLAAPQSPVLSDIANLLRMVLDLPALAAPQLVATNVFGRLFRAVGLK